MNKKILLLTTLIFLLTIVFVSSVTVTGSSSSYTFIVENCTSNKIGETLNCTSEYIRFSCDFSPVAFIDEVEFRIQGIDYVSTQNSINPNQFYYDYFKITDTSGTTVPIIFDRQRITDVDDKKVNANLLVSINRSCEVCPASYTIISLTSCNITDQQIISYVSSNETCLPSYNNSEYCDYCSEDLEELLGVCNDNGTQTVDYQDNNYYSCCMVTSNIFDCDINYYPFNTTTVQSCSYLDNDFFCEYDSEPYLNNDKINVQCELPSNDTYCCVINLYKDEKLLGTTPEYKDASDSLLNLRGEEETRECFTPNSRLVNAYYKSKNLRVGQSFVMEMKCMSDFDTLRTQYLVNPVYEDAGKTLDYVVWARNNTEYLIVGLFVLLLLLSLVGYVLVKLRGRR